VVGVERIKSRLSQLLTKGQKLLFGKVRGEYVDPGEFQEWKIMCRSFLGSVFGDPSMELAHFDQCSTFHDVYRVQQAVGVLRGILDNLEFGSVGNLEGFISATIYSDFLDMAKKLLAQEDSKLVDLAAYLVGAVLEDGLRRIAQKHPTIRVRESDNISSLNSKLADAEVYDTLWRRKLHVWDGVRSNADHGHFGRNAPNDVQQMLDGVRDFLAIFLSTQS
jgi:hypothetical protein